MYLTRGLNPLAGDPSYALYYIYIKYRVTGHHI